MTGNQYLSTRKAAAFLGLSPRTMDRNRMRGEGPSYYRFGHRILYRRADLEEWAEARRVALGAGSAAARRGAPGRGRRRPEGAVMAARDGNARMVRALRNVALCALPAALALAGLGMDAALASTDTTFDGPLDTVSGIVEGTGGQLAAALAVGAALVGSVLRFNAMQLMGAVGVGVAAGAGVGIVTGLVGTAIV